VKFDDSNQGLEGGKLAKLLPVPIAKNPSAFDFFIIPLAFLLFGLGISWLPYTAI